METSSDVPPDAPASRMKTRLLRAVGFLAALAVPAVLFLLAGGAHPSAEALQLRPFPDATEVAWTAWAMAHGLPVQMPVGNEWHPSRFHPVHATLMALWLRVNAGDWDALFTFSPLLAMLTAAAWVATLRVMGVTFPFLLAAGLLLLLAPTTFDVSQGILQDGSLGLLMALGTLCSVTGLKSLTAEDAARWRWLVAGALAGIAFGLAVCARPTLVMLPLALLAAVVGTLRDRRGIEFAAALAVGGVAATLASLAYGLVVLGSPAVNGYGYWIGEHRELLSAYWSVSNLFDDPVDPEQDPRWVLVFGALVGLQPIYSAGGCVVYFVGWCGAIISLVQKATGNPTANLQRIVVLTCAISVLLHTIVHGLYSFHLPRFYYSIAGAYVVLLCIGMQRLATIGYRFFARSDLLLPVFLFACIVVAGFLLLGTLRVYYEQRHLTGSETDVTSLLWVERLPVELSPEYPVFVHGFGSLQARLLFGLERHAHPVVPLAQPAGIYDDGQIRQFSWRGEIEPPGGRFESPDVWGASPFENALLARDEELEVEVQRERVTAVLDAYGGFHVIGRQYSGPVFLQLQSGLLWHEAPSPDPEIVLFFVERSPFDDDY